MGLPVHGLLVSFSPRGIYCPNFYTNFVDPQIAWDPFFLFVFEAFYNMVNFALMASLCET